MRKTFIAETDIEGHRFVTFGAEDGTVKPTTSATDPVIGTTNFIGAKENTPVDVDFARYSEVKLAGTVAKGDGLVPAHDGCANKGDNAVAMALASGVEDDIIPVLMK